VNENHNYIDYDSIPENNLKTLESEYGQYYMSNFDWNTQLEFFNKGSFDGKGWKEWLENNKCEQFTKNIDKIKILNTSWNRFIELVHSIRKEPQIKKLFSEEVKKEVKCSFLIISMLHLYIVVHLTLTL
jgi:hypothetical protein